MYFVKFFCSVKSKSKDLTASGTYEIHESVYHPAQEVEDHDLGNLKFI